MSLNASEGRLSQALQAIVDRGEAARQRLAGDHAAELEQHRSTIRQAVQRAAEALERNVAEVTGRNPTCERLVKNVNRYVDWLQWSLWDLPHLAVALRLDSQRLAQGVASCGMVYLSMRLFDDVIDRHHSYKGRHDTLLALCHADRASNQDGSALAVLGALLLCFDGLDALAKSDDPRAVVSFRALTDAIKKTVMGAVMEMSPREEWRSGYYERLIHLKNVEFWRALYSGLDTDESSPFRAFLERYYALAQKINDVQDHVDDERRGQPNLVNISRMEERQGDPAPTSVSRGMPRAVEQSIASDFAELASAASALPERQRWLVEVKLAESLADARRAGLFTPINDAKVDVAGEALGLQWYSDVGDVLSKLGPEALVERACAVCGGGASRFLFKKQGFSYVRCTRCTHVYVSPRLHPDLAFRMGLELDDADHESAIMDVQKHYAAAVCSLLRVRAPGSRLLDVGYGRGYLVELARAYGLETYGVEASPNQLKSLDDRMGRRLWRSSTADQSLPWGSFDAVIVSHVLEHTDDPRGFLESISSALNPEGVIYVAVPDMDSAQFRIFGKRWDPITPLAHQQYFNKASLSRLLESVGFRQPERIDHVPIPDDLASRWMRLMREIGGSDSGELALIAQKPPS